ncbi:hypothetical protein CLV56_0151 [Mumia flava]|uniref:Lipoprotein n=1 Tax=Mumia flava TaxID=1348852 RepID=A0A2M9BDE2_9ACTN|nr:hypothetical protein [Mumia flava]PJJ55948.1 hypothetical protein CLV56_0151 [Mumia flava]
MRRILVLLVVLASVLVLGGCGHSWAWRQADLDRNRFDLGLFRGARDASTLSTWTRYGTVVSATGAAEHGDDAPDLAIVVRYERTTTDWAFNEKDEVACYRFEVTAADLDGVAFAGEDCPGD